jgi:hypothetical protein
VANDTVLSMPNLELLSRCRHDQSPSLFCFHRDVAKSFSSPIVCPLSRRVVYCTKKHCNRNGTGLRGHLHITISSAFLTNPLLTAPHLPHSRASSAASQSHFLKKYFQQVLARITVWQAERDRENGVRDVDQRCVGEADYLIRIGRMVRLHFFFCFPTTPAIFSCLTSVSNSTLLFFPLFFLAHCSPDILLVFIRCLPVFYSYSFLLSSPATFPPIPTLSFFLFFSHCNHNLTCLPFHKFVQA